MLQIGWEKNKGSLIDPVKETASNIWGNQKVVHEIEGNSKEGVVDYVGGFSEVKEGENWKISREVLHWGHFLSQVRLRA